MAETESMLNAKWALEGSRCGFERVPQPMGTVLASLATVHRRRCRCRCMIKIQRLHGQAVTPTVNGSNTTGVLVRGGIGVAAEHAMHEGMAQVCAYTARKANRHQWCCVCISGVCSRPTPLGA